MKINEKCQEYQITNQKDYEKYTFEYYLISQMSSQIDYAQILKEKDEPVFNCETLILYQNKANQIKKELPTALKNFEKWSFPQGIKLIQQSDVKFKMLDEFYRDPQAKLGSQIHEINYFVVTDLTTLQKYYCTSAYFYEKIIMVDNDNQPHQFFMPKSHVIMSQAPFYSAQKSLIGYLLYVHRMRQNGELDKIVQVNQSGKIYGIEQSKLFEYYIQYSYDNCLLSEDNLKFQLKFHSNDKFILYYTKNNINNTFYSIVNPSNNFFESLIFGQSPYNLLCLITFIILEYQIIFVSKRTNSLTLFAENLLDLIKPLFWRGVYIPNLIVPSMFDYEKSKLPYIIGINRNLYKSTDKSNKNNEGIGNRVVYDVDENQILYLNEVSSQNQIRAPLAFRNYFMRKINLIIGDIKFYEDEYFSQAILRYKQFFYNFILLLFHDLLNFFSKGANQDNHQRNKSQGEIQNPSMKAEPAPFSTTTSSHNFYKSTNCLDQQQSNGGTSNNSFQQIAIKQNNPANLVKRESTPITISEQNSQIKKKIVYFNYTKYIASFEEADQPFFQAITKTLIFNGLIKDCFRAIEFREEFFEQERKKQWDYNFGSILCFIEDSKFLAASSSNELTLNDRIKQLEENQHKIIAEQLSGTPLTEILLSADDGIADYLESAFRVNSRPDSYDKTPSSHIYSSYLSSFLNNPLDMHKEIVHQSSFGNRQKKVVQSNINTFEHFKEEHAPNFQSKDQFYQQYSLEKKSKYLQQQKEINSWNILNGKLLSDFNDELWQINTQPNEDITNDTNRNNINSINENNCIKELSLINKKDRLSYYLRQDDEEELIQKRYQHKFEGSSTVFEVHSAYSAHPNRMSRKNSFKEFTKISNEFNLLSIGKNTLNAIQKSNSSLYPAPEDLLSSNVDK